MPYVCPWWGGYFIDNPLRRLLHDPQKILSPYIRSGMTVLDVGCGMGWFSLALAQLVGDQGRVVAVDLQRKMLDTLRRRAERATVAHRIQTHRCEQNQLGIHIQVDFALAFAMVHEVPDQERLLREIRDCLQPGGLLLVAEPRVHVSGRAFQRTETIALELGLEVAERPAVRWCRAVVLRKAVR